MITVIMAACTTGWAQFPALPKITVDRRADFVYMDSLSQALKGHYQRFTAMPRKPQTDTLRLESLYLLGRTHGMWQSRRDSMLYYGYELAKQAQALKNTEFEVRGILLREQYFHTLKIDYPRAMQINFEAMAVMEKARTLPPSAWRVDMNLGELYSLSGDDDNAFRLLMRAKQRLLTNGRLDPVLTTSHQMTIEQKIGLLFNRQGKFSESEQHYLAAAALLSDKQPKLNAAYVYGDLAELYLKYELYDKALTYARKAEKTWKSLEPTGKPNESNLSMLAHAQAALGQHEQAEQYALALLALPKPLSTARRRAYFALYQVYSDQQKWAASLFYFKRFVALRDSAANDLQSRDLALLRNKNEIERVEAQNRQQQQLQAQRLLTLSKQAELDRLKAVAQQRELRQQALLSEQQRRFEQERATSMLARQQINHRLEQQSFAQKTLEQENRTQQNWIFYITTSSALLLGILILLLYMVQLRKRKAEADLRLAIERKETDARIIKTQDAERQRIAADLHDDLGGTLATIRQRMASLQEHTNDAFTRQAFIDLEPLIQKSGHDLRRIAHNLMPPELMRIGLRGAVEQLIKAIPKEPTTVDCLVTGSEKRLPIEVELTTYRIISELVQNILKHARARRASVQLLYEETYLTVQVEDDGVGMTDEALANKQGMGLTNNTLRADHIGATLHMETGSGGTFIILEIPYSASHALPNSDRRRSPAIQ
ncbi:tetratricopeptide repeat-containing sensor histidine kinase [Fibrella arboris]|uniref:tetratricopeptide repeat-containing sensor histidine kinase n=1 Tax=Fibrella arboris TaxID=3242486 RepID=UPI00351F8715